ncbi:MAG: glycosyltransferase family 4 protein [Solirubrobacteraceae bacterium]
MRVGVDARHLAAGRGVAHYTSALLAALAARYSRDEWVAFAPAGAPVPPGVELVAYPMASRLLFGAAALGARPRIDCMIGGPPIDILWAPAPAPFALSAATPLVLTVHDLSFELRPQDFTPYERLWHRLARPRALACRAARILAVSEATRSEVTEHWGIAPERVELASPGVSAPGRGAPLDQPLPRPYLLAVGALEPRKAPDLLVRAFVDARARGLEATLVFAGQGRLAARLAAPGVSVLGRVSAAQLETLYADALALVNPSLLEGFGFTALEALARGIPPVLSDLPVYGETVGEAALRFPLGDQQALADALLRIAADADLRERIVARGRAAVARLTWERCAERAHAAMELAAAL